MAIEVGEDWKARGGGVDDNGVRTLTRGWWAKTDADTTGEPAVIDAVIAKFPYAALYAAHPDWKWALCRGPKAKPNGSARAWVVTAEYSTAPFPAKGDGGAGSGSGLGAPVTDGGSATAPTVDQSNQKPANERPATVTISRKEITVPLEFDLSGARVLNTVGDPFIPPIEVFRTHRLITFKFLRKPEDLNWAAREAYLDTVNSNAVVIFGKTYPKYSLRVADYSLDTQWDTGDAGLALFFALTVQLESKPDLWKLKILNTGRRKRVTGGSLTDPTKVINIVDAAGQPVADPVPLNEDGSLAPVGGPYWYLNAPDYIDGYTPKNFDDDPGLLS